MNRGRLIVFSAPSGCGKGTMLAEITKNEKFCCSVSATTRDPREGEIPNVSYYYITKEEFLKKVEENAFLEHAKYVDNFYGTYLSEVEPRLEKGINVILEIEVQGAMRVREARPDALLIFVLPPSITELRRRLNKRGTEEQEVIEKRIAQAKEEIEYAPKYDYVIVNDALEDAVNDFFSIIRAEELKAAKSGELINEVKKDA
ncbi:MAG TPA: guanylate kinase [Ruminococcus flavefaciens]|nr:guanylate kinase [Ruminococcus flavefaciens]